MHTHARAQCVHPQSTGKVRGLAVTELSKDTEAKPVPVKCPRSAVCFKPGLSRSARPSPQTLPETTSRVRCTERSQAFLAPEKGSRTGAVPRGVRKPPGTAGELVLLAEGVPAEDLGTCDHG